MIKCLLVLIAEIAFILLPPILIDGVELESWVKTALGAYLSVLIIIAWTLSRKVIMIDSRRNSIEQKAHSVFFSYVKVIAKWACYVFALVILTSSLSLVLGV